MSISFALREFTIPPRREIRSLLGFSDKSTKKSRNFRCYAQKPSILHRSCPTCWDITLRYDSTSLGNWHLMLGPATSYHLEAKCSWGKLDSEPRQDTSKGNSNCVHVLVVLQGHTLKGNETTRIGSKWTLGYAMFGPQVLSPYKKAI
jgi:hypothetical protein